MNAPLEPFESWLLHRVAQAVEAGEVSADLLTELQAEIQAARDRPQAESHAEAVREMAERLGIPLAEAERALAAVEAQPRVTREMLLLQIVEAWLEGQRKARGLMRKPAKAPHDFKNSL